MKRQLELSEAIPRLDCSLPCVKVGRQWGFGRGRKSAFSVFSSSAVAETQYFPFCSFRPWPKLCFCCFLLIGHGRKPIFIVFSLSAVADERFSASFSFSSVDDEQFLAFLAFRRPTTSSFWRFSCFVGRRRAIFRIFCISSADNG